MTPFEPSFVPGNEFLFRWDEQPEACGMCSLCTMDHAVTGPERFTFLPLVGLVTRYWVQAQLSK